MWDGWSSAWDGRLGWLFVWKGSLGRSPVCDESSATVVWDGSQERSSGTSVGDRRLGRLCVWHGRLSGTVACDSRWGRPSGAVVRDARRGIRLLRVGSVALGGSVAADAGGLRGGSCWAHWRALADAGASGGLGGLGGLGGGLGGILADLLGDLADFSRLAWRAQADWRIPVQHAIPPGICRVNL